MGTELSASAASEFRPTLVPFVRSRDRHPRDSRDSLHEDALAGAVTIRTRFQANGDDVANTWTSKEVGEPVDKDAIWFSAAAAAGSVDALKRRLHR